jgi:hypothetical protein
MKSFALALVFFFLACCTNGQLRTDSFKKSLSINNDTLKLVTYRLLCDAFFEINQDSAIVYSNKYLQLAQKLNYKLFEADALRQIAWSASEENPASSLDRLFEALQIIEQNARGTS